MSKKRATKEQPVSVVEEKKESESQPSQLYYTIATHCEALRQKGANVETPPSNWSEEKLQKLYDEMHLPSGKYTKHFK